jgi:hypothetical protein
MPIRVIYVGIFKELLYILPLWIAYTRSTINATPESFSRLSSAIILALTAGSNGEALTIAVQECTVKSIMSVYQIIKILEENMYTKAAFHCSINNIKYGMSALHKDSLIVHTST